MNTTTVKTASAPSPVEFPVATFREAAPHLRRPFMPAAVKFKVQATWETGGLIVAYIDARLAVERLNLVLADLWYDAYRPIGNGQMWCDLTVDGITRSDIGEGTGKGLVSDALKRAAVKFGVGVSLYATPSLMLNNQHLKRKGNAVTITDEGMRVVRATYEAWLDGHGRQAFGEPLDHGDVDGAQGDHEADDKPAVEKPPPAAPHTDGIGTAAAAALLLNADAAGLTREQLARAVEHAYGRPLLIVSDIVSDDEGAAVAALTHLSPAHEQRVAAWIERKRGGVAA